MDEIIQCLEQMSVQWEWGLGIYQAVLGGATGRRARQELVTAQAIGHVWRSALHLYRVFRLCRHWNGRQHSAAYRQLCAAELANCRALLPLLEQDERLGFHVECPAHLFDHRSVRRKTDWLRKLVGG